MIDYVDPLSGRWAARICCARCGRETGLAVGDARHGNIFPNNPLATMLSRQGIKRSVPPAEKIGFGPPAKRPGAVEIQSPAGVPIRVRALKARFAFGRIRTVYLAAALDASRLPTVSADLRRALALVSGPTNEQWLERTARQLEAELPVDS
jgi:hypothetical protein